MTKSRDLWQLLQGLRAERAVVAWNAYVIRSLRKWLCYFRTALLSPRFSPIIIIQIHKATLADYSTSLCR